jgi:hypothetical protein
VSAPVDSSDCWSCPTHKAIRQYSTKRYSDLAQEAVVQLEQIGATSIFGDDYKHRTFWDEFCHEMQEGPHSALEWAFEATLDPLIHAIVEGIENSEATLLTIGAMWDLGEDQEMGADIGRTPYLIQRNLEQAVKSLAMTRDMSEFDPLAEESPCSTEDEDIELLERLAKAVRSLAPFAQTGHDLIAVGEACDAIEKFLESEAVDVNVGLTFGIRRGDPGFDEGHYVRIRINACEIILDEMNSTCSSDSRSDHNMTFCAFLEPGGGFDEYGVGDWISKVEALRTEDAKLGVERDHA